MKDRLVSICEALSLKQAILIWFAGVFVFSLIYCGVSLSQQNSVSNALYFSFITATTIGYGDIAPIGIAKIFAILEAIFSLTVFGLIIYKIVSVKQEEVLEEIQELNFEESTNEAVSKLYIFRSDIKLIKEDIEHKAIKTKTSQKATKNINSTQELQDFENSLENLSFAFNSLKQTTKKLAAEPQETKLMRIELITNSINFSLSRLIELLETFNNKKINWKKESTTSAIAYNQEIARELYNQYNKLKSNDSSNKVEEKLEDLNKTLTTLEKLTQA